MFRWFRRREPGPKPTDVNVALAAIEEVLNAGPAGQGFPSRLYGALHDLSVGGAFDAHRARLQQQFAKWFARHPFEVHWDRSVYFHVVDPVGIPLDDLFAGDDVPELVPWAALARSLVITGGSSNAFRDGCMAKDLTEVLRHPHAPVRLEQLRVPSVDYRDVRELDELVGVLCEDALFVTLRHLAIQAGRLTSHHFERLAASTWAASLETLDLTEAMIDWHVDRSEAERAATWRALGKFQSLTHLVMYNNFGESSDVAIFLETSFPRLTHLNLGCPPTTDDFLELVAGTKALPNLKELCLSDGPPRTSGAWDRICGAPFEVYLHGQRVTADYPKRR